MPCRQLLYFANENSSKSCDGWVNYCESWSKTQWLCFIPEEISVFEQICCVNEWLTHKDTCLIPERISVFKQISWVNDSLTHSWRQSLSEWISFFWINLWMNQIKTHSGVTCFHTDWNNRKSENAHHYFKFEDCKYSLPNVNLNKEAE